LILLPLVSQVVVFRGPIQEKETPDAETLYLPIALQHTKSKQNVSRGEFSIAPPVLEE
jgi:hypothetical protein